MNLPKGQRSPSEGFALPTLDYFLADPHSRNAWVREPGFQELYVRKGPRWLGEASYHRVVDIASATATYPGRGALTALIKRLHRGIPRADANGVLHTQGEILYMESILNQRLVARLLRMGFTLRPDSIPPCLYLLSTDTLRDV